MKKEFKHELGTKVREKITGFTGVITSRIDYLTGCNQYCVLPKCKEEGVYPEGQYFDEERLEVLNEEKLNPKDFQGEKNGADHFPSKKY